MKLSYDIIAKNLETYQKAKSIFPAISQFEEGQLEYSAMHSLGLGAFAEFHYFLKKNAALGYSPIMDVSTFRTLKPMIVENTSSERFKTFMSNRTQKKFDAMFTDRDLFDRLLNGPWKSRPKMRRNGRMGSGTRKSERAEGLEKAIVPIINYLIARDLEFMDLREESRISDIKWYSTHFLSIDSIPQREIELTSKLLQAFSDTVDKERIDFRKLNIDYVISAISSKIRNAMKIPKGTMLKCISDLSEDAAGNKYLISSPAKSILTKDSTYEVLGTYERNGFLTVYIRNDQGRCSYYEYSYFEDISIRRDDLLSMLLD